MQAEDREPARERPWNRCSLFPPDVRWGQCSAPERQNQCILVAGIEPPRRHCDPAYAASLRRTSSFARPTCATLAALVEHVELQGDDAAVRFLRGALLQHRDGRRDRVAGTHRLSKVQAISSRPSTVPSIRPAREARPNAMPTIIGPWVMRPLNRSRRENLVHVQRIEVGGQPGERRDVGFDHHAARRLDARSDSTLRSSGPCRLSVRCHASAAAGLSLTTARAGIFSQVC